MTISESLSHDPWDLLPPAVIANGGVRADVTTLQNFRVDCDSYHPMYLFWDLYRPTLKDGQGTRTSAPRLSKQVDRAVLSVLESLYNRCRLSYEPDRVDSDVREFLEAHDDDDDGTDPEELDFPETLKNALVFIHVAAARAFKIQQSDGFSDEVRECLNELERTLDRLGRAGFDHKYSAREYGYRRLEGVGIYHSTLAVSAFSILSLGRISQTEGRYADALKYLARAGELYEYALPTPMGIWEAWPLGRQRPKPGTVRPGYYDIDKDFNYFATEGLRLSPKEFVELVELIKLNSRSIDDWRSVVDSCLTLANQRISWRFDQVDEELHLEDFEFGDADCWELLEEHSRRVRMPDEDGSQIAWGEFWHGAKAWAASQLSPGEYRRMREDDERNAAETRLKNYFLGGGWAVLPERAKERLVSADINFNSQQKASKESILNDLLRVMEEVCHQAVPQLIRGGPMKALEATKASKVRDYIREFEKPYFRDCITRHGLGRSDVQFLTNDLPAYLRQLADDRNSGEHTVGATVPQERVRSHYSRFLGIGCPGILPRFAGISKGIARGRG